MNSFMDATRPIRVVIVDDHLMLRRGIAQILVAAGLVGGISAPVVLAPLLEPLGGTGFFAILAIVAAICSILSLRLYRRLPELRG